jgi:hypothetical protein
MLRRTIKPDQQDCERFCIRTTRAWQGCSISSILHIDKETTLPETLTGVERLPLKVV